jgi:hypothetical protein
VQVRVAPGEQRALLPLPLPDRDFGAAVAMAVALVGPTGGAQPAAAHFPIRCDGRCVLVGGRVD